MRASITSTARPGFSPPARRCCRGSFLLAVLESGAQDIAQRSARIRRAVGGDRLLFLGDFEGLDRQRDLAGLAVVLGDAGVDLVALGETLGTLVVAVAAEIGAADERGHLAVGDLD